MDADALAAGLQQLFPDEQFRIVGYTAPNSAAVSQATADLTPEQKAAAATAQAQAVQKQIDNSLSGANTAGTLPASTNSPLAQAAATFTADTTNPTGALAQANMASDPYASSYSSQPDYAAQYNASQVYQPSYDQQYQVQLDYAAQQQQAQRDYAAQQQAQRDYEAQQQAQRDYAAQQQAQRDYEAQQQAQRFYEAQQQAQRDYEAAQQQQAQRDYEAAQQQLAQRDYEAAQQAQLNQKSYESTFTQPTSQPDYYNYSAMYGESAADKIGSTATPKSAPQSSASQSGALAAANQPAVTFTPAPGPNATAAEFDAWNEENFGPNSPWAKSLATGTGAVAPITLDTKTLLGQNLRNQG
jgi:hypothetical protein